MRELRIRPLARADLEQVWSYTLERWGVEQADRYLRGIGVVLRLLAEHPALGRDESKLREHYRSYLVGRHVIYYVFDDATLSVVRVLHCSLDRDAQL
ncbi:MAG TPA: type II toxin-antitoxin system RelE/ParE family toxin [Planctomycetota bacterium]|nr:type II toxin-antitoxin system RelE/ParE family toxin [Planctomycetota bacterium]